MIKKKNITESSDEEKSYIYFTESSDEKVTIWSCVLERITFHTATPCS